MAAVVVVVGVAFAGQALAGSELQQTFKAAKQNGENLVEVIRLALQAGANLNDVAAAANEAGIGMDTVTAAALAAGQEPSKVARAVEQGADTNLGYQEPAGSRPLSGYEATSGSTEVAGTSFQGSRVASVLNQEEKDKQDKDKPCREDKICQPASGALCCQTNSTNLPKCQPHDKCK